MTAEQYQKNLKMPTGPVDVVLDTDAYNEIDDQYAICYLVACGEKLKTQAFYAAPFSKAKEPSVKRGMEESHREICDLLKMMGVSYPVFKGSDRYLENETTPVISDAAKDLAERALRYSPENPLYVIAIGAITNIASAILLEPKVAENTVVIWLGGHAHHFHDTHEFNMFQDVAASRVVMGSGVPFVQLPCNGVVSAFTLSEPELEKHFDGKTKLMDYLSAATKVYVEERYPGMPWAKPIWDVTAIAWLMNEDDAFMVGRTEKCRLSDYNNIYEAPLDKDIHYVYHIFRNKLMDDMIRRIRGLG